MTACSVKEHYSVNEIPVPENKQEGIKLEFIATTGIETETKTTLIQDGELPNGQPQMVTWWSPEEDICIFYGASAGNKFTSTNTELVQKATFSGTLNAFTGENESGDFNYFWAVYPFDAAVSCDGESVVAILADEQEACAGTYANNTNVTIAKSPGLSLGFYNVCSFLRFTVEKEGVIAATLRGNNYEYVAGEFSVSMGNDGRPTAPVIVDGEREVTLRRPNNEPFVVGTSYYFVILPQTFESGFTVQFDTEYESGNRVISSSVPFTRNSINYGITAFDHGVSYVRTKPRNNELLYTSSDGETISCSISGLESNTYENGVGVMQFDHDLSEIPSSAFYGKTNLTTLTIPSSVTSIGSQAFYNCSSLTSIKGLESISSISSYAFGYCTGLTSFAIPAGVDRIISSTFYNCTGLTTVSIPNSVTLIGQFAFSGCTGLKTITIPESVTTFGLGALSRTGLTSISLPSSITTVRQSLFSGCEDLTTVVLPESVTTIETNVFNGCTALTTVNIPSKVTSIPESMFFGCTGLTTYTIPNNITSIGNMAFQGCSGLESIVIPNSVSTIGEQAFYLCSSLESITLPENLTSLGRSAFSACTGLESITVEAITPPTGATNMFINTNNAPIYVPVSSVATYKSALQWSDYAERIYANPNSIPTAVDLGLSVKWASRNIGADAAEQTGDYFAWGEVATKNWFDSYNYLWCPNGSAYSSTMKLTRYCPSSKTSYWDGDGAPDNKTTFSDYDYADDAASVLLGNHWRIPTESEWSELRNTNNCDWTWTSQNGKNGYLITSKKTGFTGNSIFLPAAGYISDNYKTSVNTAGYYWGSIIDSSQPTRAYMLIITSSSINWSSGGRDAGQPIRAVYVE